jgi:hypothetical protein
MKTRSLVTTAAIAALLSIVPTVAHARSQPGQMAIGLTAADRACFGTYYTAVVNTCSTTNFFLFPIVADTSGYKTFTITAYGASSSSNVQCQSVGVDQDIDSAWTSGAFQALPAFGSTQNMVETVYTPNLGGYYVQCYIGPGARVDIINFTP